MTAKLTFGLPYVAPVAQTILPIITSSGSMKGFIPITKTTFSEPNQMVAHSSQFVLATSVTLPSMGRDGTNHRLEQYAAIVVPLADEWKKPWLGFPDLVSPESSGYYSWFSMPTLGMVHHFGQGALLHALNTNMGVRPEMLVPVEEPGYPGLPTPVVWNATVNSSEMALMAFFDFNWLDLFKAKLGDEYTLWKSPVITVLANPQSGEFKAAVIQGQPTSGPLQANLVFDALRIMKLRTPIPGTYTFEFRVTDRLVKTLTKSCLLNLTIG